MVVRRGAAPRRHRAVPSPSEVAVVHVKECLGPAQLDRAGLQFPLDVCEDVSGLCGSRLDVPLDGAAVLGLLGVWVRLELRV